MSTGKIENVIIICYHVLINYPYFIYIKLYIIFVVNDRCLYKALYNLLLHILWPVQAINCTTHARVTGSFTPRERNVMKNIDKTLDRLVDATVTALSWLNELAMLDMSASEEAKVKEVIDDFKKSGVTPDDEEYCLNDQQLNRCIDKDIGMISGLVVPKKAKKERLVKKLNNIKTLMNVVIRYYDEHPI